MSGYAEFLVSKHVAAPEVGFDVALEDLNPLLFGFQRRVTQWGLRQGRAAAFASTGLGKTPIALEYSRHVREKTNGAVLILTPLAVAHQFASEAEKFGVEDVHVARTSKEARRGITVTNYERLEHFDPSNYAGVVLDEASILKAFGGKTRWRLNRAFAQTPYRLSCTATPAPNQHTELGTQAHFLGVMDHGEMLTRWFINNTKEARELRLKRHGEADFWRWVASWAACVSMPSDVLDEDGRPYPDDGFVLPELDLREHVAAVDYREAQAEEGTLFRLETKLSGTALYRELRRTVSERTRMAAELVAEDPDEPWAIWCNTNYEADALKDLMPGAVEVRGSESVDAKEEKLAAFSRGEILHLVTKPSIAAFGLNWQHCARTAFVGLNYSFEQMHQALRRFWRFGQERPVVAHVITAETETAVLKTIRKKQKGYQQMQEKMSSAMQEAGINAGREQKLVGRAKIGAGMIRTERAENGSWTLHQGDCVEVTTEIPDESVHLSVFSPPFSSLYSYSPSLRDMGNCQEDEEFFEHFSHLVPELLRILVSGRLVCMHTKDLIRYRNRYGYGGMRDFTGEITRAMEEYVAPDGSRFGYHSKVTIWKDPVREMQRTKSYGLLYKTLRRDASYSRTGSPEYLVMFRKWTPEADSPEPVEHTRDEFPLEVWQRYASPVWDDIMPTDVLNTKIARSDKDEKHLAPLQLGIIERCCEIWTNPGDVVFDPFAGVASTGFQALQMDRRFVGIELKSEYFNLAVKHLTLAEGGVAQPDLLAALEAGERPV